MILAQYILITPIITGISLAAIKAVPKINYRDCIYSRRHWKKMQPLRPLKEARFGIITAVLAGLGRALCRGGSNSHCRRQHCPYRKRGWNRRRTF